MRRPPVGFVELEVRPAHAGDPRIFELHSMAGRVVGFVGAAPVTRHGKCMEMDVEVDVDGVGHKSIGITALVHAASQGFDPDLVAKLQSWANEILDGEDSVNQATHW